MTEPLDLEPIKARLADFGAGWVPRIHVVEDPLLADLAALVAEVERLRGVVDYERSRAELMKRHAQRVGEVLSADSVDRSVRGRTV